MVFSQAWGIEGRGNEGFVQVRGISLWRVISERVEGVISFG